MVGDHSTIISAVHVSILEKDLSFLFRPVCFISLPERLNWFPDTVYLRFRHGFVHDVLSQQRFAWPDFTTILTGQVFGTTPLLRIHTVRIEVDLIPKHSPLCISRDWDFLCHASQIVQPRLQPVTLWQNCFECEFRACLVFNNFLHCQQQKTNDTRLCTQRRC